MLYGSKNVSMNHREDAWCRILLQAQRLVHETRGSITFQLCFSSVCSSPKLNEGNLEVEPSANKNGGKKEKSNELIQSRLLRFLKLNFLCSSLTFCPVKLILLSCSLQYHSKICKGITCFWRMQMHHRGKDLGHALGKQME